MSWVVYDAAERACEIKATLIAAGYSDEEAYARAFAAAIAELKLVLRMLDDDERVWC
jgi:hypothetical protein